MSSFRKKRPLERSESGYRDDSLLIISSEDRYATKQYFEFFPNQRIRIITLPTKDEHSSPRAVLDRLLRYQREHTFLEEDQYWIAIDVDHWAKGNHRKALSDVIKECQQKNIGIAISNPCFDLWLLLHQTALDSENPPKNGDEIAIQFRQITGSFNKTRLNRDHYPHDKIREAVKRAKKLDTSPDDWIPELPCTRVYRIVEQAIEKDFIRLGLE